MAASQTKMGRIKEIEERIKHVRLTILNTKSNMNENYKLIEDISKIINDCYIDSFFNYDIINRFSEIILEDIKNGIY